MTIERLPTPAAAPELGLRAPETRLGTAGEADALAVGPRLASVRPAWTDDAGDEGDEAIESLDDDDAAGDDPPWAQLWPLPAEGNPARRASLALAPSLPAPNRSFAARVVALHQLERGHESGAAPTDRQLHAVHDRRLMLAVGRLGIILLAACLGAVVSFYAAYVNT